MHGPDVLVVDFNGNATRGIEQHVQWAMAAITAAPESRVLAHQIKNPFLLRVYRRIKM